MERLRFVQTDRLQPALVTKPLCSRLVPTTSTSECILLDALNDVTDVSEATKQNFLSSAVRVELSSSEKVPDMRHLKWF